MKNYRFFSLFIIILFLILFDLRLNFLEKIDLTVEDSKFLFRKLINKCPPLFQNAVIVAIDEKSINQIGRWPWDRKIIAKIIKKLKYAKLIVLDIVFSEPQDSYSDKILAQSIKNANNVILGFFLRDNSTEKIKISSLDLLLNSEFIRYKTHDDYIPLPSFPFAEVNLPEFMNYSLASGLLNIEPDIDGIYRKYSIAYVFKNSIYLSLSFQAYRYYLNRDFLMEFNKYGIKKLEINSFDIPIYNNYYVKLNFYDNKSINKKVFSAVDIINGNLDPKFFKNKIVFIGVTEVGIYDVRPTPIDALTPGVYLHFTSFSNLALNQFFKKYNIIDFFSIILLGFLGFLFSFIKKFKIRIYLYLFLLFIFIIIANYLFSFRYIDIDIFFPCITLLFISVFQESIYLFFAEKDVRYLKKAFKNYVSPQLLQIIIKNPDKLKLGGEKRHITVLFSDIRGFTSLSEKMDPATLISLLNEYFDPVTKLVLKHQGMLDKYIGDALMAIFNAPVDIENYADKACYCALDIVRELKNLNKYFKEKYHLQLKIGIGIHTGTAIIGNIGSSIRFDYTAIGDTVNIASRLEGLTKLYKTNILITEETKRRLTASFLLRKIDIVAVKGKEEAVMIFELMENTSKNRQIITLFEKAWEIYFKGDFSKAYLLFTKILKEYRDPPSQVFAQRCKDYSLNPPSFWDGIFRAKTK